MPTHTLFPFRPKWNTGPFKAMCPINRLAFPLDLPLFWVSPLLFRETNHVTLPAFLFSRFHISVGDRTANALNI